MDYGTCQYLLVAILVIAVLPRWGVLGQDPCVKINSCSCKNSQGTIDLSPLDSGGGTNPKFKDVPSTDAGSNSFSWNPCTAFSEGDGSCTNVAVCQIEPGQPPAYFNIGLEKTAKFMTNGQKQVSIQYTDETAAGRTTTVKLVCDQSKDPGTMTAQGEGGTAKYGLTYTGKFACPKSAPPITTTTAPPITTTLIPTPGGPGGLSVESILCIASAAVCVIILVIYAVWDLKFRSREAIFYFDSAQPTQQTNRQAPSAPLYGSIPKSCY